MSIKLVATLTNFPEQPWIDIYEDLGEQVRRHVCHNKDEAFQIAAAWKNGDYSTPGKVKEYKDGFWTWRKT